MNNLDAILEVSIGLVFVWLILSAATMEAQNIWGRIFQLRAKFLEKSILGMFQGKKEYVETFYDHPAIQELYRKGFLGRTKRPDYIPSPVFAEVALEIFINLGLDEGEQGKDSVSAQKIIDKVDAIYKENPELGYALRRVLPNFDGTETLSKAKNVTARATELKKNAEGAFDAAMTRASFWYKEKAQAIAFLFGFIIAILINVDTISVAQQLWRDPTLRQSLVAQAQTIEENAEVVSVADLEDYYQEINLPIGWTTELVDTPIACKGISMQNNHVLVAKESKCYKVAELPAMNNFWGWILKILGFTFSAAAAMQGAPFWFAMLKNLLDLKGKPKKDKEEKDDASPAPTSTPKPVG